MREQLEIFGSSEVSENHHQAASCTAERRLSFMEGINCWTGLKLSDLVCILGTAIHKS